MDQLPRLEKRELIGLLLFTCNYAVSVRIGFLFLWVLGMGYFILFWHSLRLPYNYFRSFVIHVRFSEMPSFLHLRLMPFVEQANINLSWLYHNGKETPRRKG